MSQGESRYGVNVVVGEEDRDRVFASSLAVCLPAWLDGEKREAA